MFTLGGNRVSHLSDYETAIFGLDAPQRQGLDVGFYDLLIVGASSCETLGHKLLEDALIDLHQVRQCAHDHHVSGSGVARGTGQIVEGHAKAVLDTLQLEGPGVEDYDSAFSDLAFMLVVSIFVEGHQHVQVIT